MPICVPFTSVTIPLRRDSPMIPASFSSRGWTRVFPFPRLWHQQSACIRPCAFWLPLLFIFLLFSSGEGHTSSIYSLFICNAHCVHQTAHFSCLNLPNKTLNFTEWNFFLPFCQCFPCLLSCRRYDWLFICGVFLNMYILL